MTTTWGSTTNGARAGGNSEGLRREAATARREALLMAVLRAARRHAIDLRPIGAGLYRATPGYLAALRSVVDTAPWVSPHRVPTNREDLLLDVRAAAARHVMAVERVTGDTYTAAAPLLERLRLAIDKAWECTHAGIEMDLTGERS